MGGRGGRIGVDNVMQTGGEGIEGEAGEGGGEGVGAEAGCNFLAQPR